MSGSVACDFADPENDVSTAVIVRDRIALFISLNSINLAPRKNKEKHAPDESDSVMADAVE